MGATMTPEIRRELQRLLSALCDGELTETEHARLEELLDADAECRRLYLEYIDMHARLLLHPQPAGGREEAPTASGPSWPGGPRQRGLEILRYVLVAAGAVAASLLVQVLWWPPR